MLLALDFKHRWGIICKATSPWHS